MKELKKIAKNLRGSYQGTDRFINIVVPHFRPYLNYLKGKDVVDVGSNAGLISCEIAKIANSCIGVEPHEKYYKQSLITKNFIKDKCIFVNETIDQFSNRSDIPYNALFASNVLYHLSDKGIEAIRKILKNCDTVLFFSRENKPKKKNKFKLHHWKNIQEFLKNEGFKTSVLTDESKIVKFVSSHKNINRGAETKHTSSVWIPVLGIR